MSLKLQIRINEHDDPDLYKWLLSQPEGHRSEAVRAVIRRGLYANNLTPEDFTEIHDIVAAVVSDIVLNGTRYDYSVTDN